MDETTATLPRGWKGRLVNLPPGHTEGVRGLCLDPHDLAISKYVARREKDRAFTRELARRYRGGLHALTAGARVYVAISPSAFRGLRPCPA